MECHKLVITSPDASKYFFRNVCTYNLAEKPKIWNLKSICPEMSDSELAVALSKYFMTISNEFDPLLPSQIPSTYSRRLPRLHPYQVMGRLRA